MFDKRTTKNLGSYIVQNLIKKVPYPLHISSDLTTTLKIRNKIVDSINLLFDMQRNSVTDIVLCLSRSIFTQILHIGTTTMRWML